MVTNHSSARDILQQMILEASAPCRIDSGGTWDIKAMALPLERIEPVTVNIALNLRTEVILSPFRDGWVKVRSQGFPSGKAFKMENLPFTPPFGLFFAAVSYFGFHGLKVDIRSDSPIKSALGGSSTALVALIKALSKLRTRLSKMRGLSLREILYLGYHLEDAVSGGNCGIQDQAAAVYGGVNRWLWNYGRSSMLERRSLLDKRRLKDISDRILVAYSGKSHVSGRINRSYVDNYLTGKTRAGWIRANDMVKGLAEAIKMRVWEKAVEFLRNEMEIRREITPDALIPITEKLIDQAEKTGCGARFAGAGAGGSVWALGEPEQIGRLRDTWKTTLSSVKGASVLDCAVDPIGVR